MIRLEKTILLLLLLLGIGFSGYYHRCASAQSYGGRFAESRNTWSQSNGWTYVRPPQTRNNNQPMNQNAYDTEQEFRAGDRKVDGSVHYNSGRIADVPVGDAKLYLTVIVGSGYQTDPRQSKVLEWFQRDPRLNRLMGETHFNVYGTDNPHFRDRLMSSVGEAAPIVMIQRPNGKVIMNVTAISMPASSGALADMCYDAVRKENPPPNFAGRNDNAVTDVTDEEDCPPDGCPVKPPVYPQPNVNPIQPTIPEVIPSGGEGEIVGAVLFAVTAVGIIFCIVVLNHRRGPPAAPSFL